ncbi:hypothetical protein Pan216_46030 [Planctomycetes bacterium Pan216]|uniref:DUF2062 domain-containing protein n=1 Tax=Kolteria novifilia TaxID=2527975 RepID=A0A518B9R5_9BACT|nr:hypothetical protein Pan216_46030 [Planctomycetes bacterium Pan216]
MVKKIKLKVRDLIQRILHADETPHQMAWGGALGMFIAWTPTVGVQMILAAFFAWLLRANKLIAVATVWISNPYTAIPIYYVNYAVGAWLTGSKMITRAWFSELIYVDQRTWAEYLDMASVKFLEILWPLWLGSILLGLILAKLTYLGIYWGMRRYRARHHVPLCDPATKSETAA